MIDGKGGAEADVRARIGKGRTAFTKLSKIERATKISKNTKVATLQLNWEVSPHVWQ